MSLAWMTVDHRDENWPCITCYQKPCHHRLVVRAGMVEIGDRLHYRPDRWPGSPESDPGAGRAGNYPGPHHGPGHHGSSVSRGFPSAAFFQPTPAPGLEELRPGPRKATAAGA